MEKYEENLKLKTCAQKCVLDNCCRILNCNFKLKAILLILSSFLDLFCSNQFVSIFGKLAARTFFESIGVLVLCELFICEFALKLVLLALKQGD